MPKIKMLTATPEQKVALDKGSKYGSTPSFRLRYQAMLLKCDADNPRTSLTIAKELGCCEMSVNAFTPA